MEYVLETNALCKRYGRFKALNGLTMHIPKGSIYGFIGRNGAGKSTLIRLICGLQTPSSGSYRIYDIDSQDRTIKKSHARMGAVVETPAVYLDMSAEENLKQQSLMLGLPTYEHIPEILKFVGLSDAGRKKARHFSFGMRQRLGIAIALVGNPDFLILDEPINGLDPQGIIEIRELVLKLNREYGITVLISSHILDELAKVATHFGFINDGRIVREMSADELNAAFRKCLCVKVSDIKALSAAMDKLGFEYQVISDNEADIFADVSLTKLVFALAEQHCELLSAFNRDENLETYFINLVGGER